MLACTHPCSNGVLPYTPSWSERQGVGGTVLFKKLVERVPGWAPVRQGGGWGVYAHIYDVRTRLTSLVERLVVAKLDWHGLSGQLSLVWIHLSLIVHNKVSLKSRGNRVSKCLCLVKRVASFIAEGGIW